MNAWSSPWSCLLDAHLERWCGASRRPWSTPAWPGSCVAAAILPSRTSPSGSRRRYLPEIEDALRAIDHGVGLELRLGGLLLLGGRSTVLVRVVVPSVPLLELQATVWETLRGCPGMPDNLAPGAWTPHVTLVRRVSPSDLSTAVDVLGGRTSAEGSVAGMRRWDGDARRAWALDG